MRTMKIGQFVLAVAGALLACGFAGAQGPGGAGMGPGFGEHRPPMERAFGPGGLQGRYWNNPNIVKQLTLTDDQRKAMDDILHKHLMTLVDLQANLKKAELEMQPLMSADTPDRAAIEGQISKVVEARAALEKANSLFLLDLRMQLKPEQWKQLKTMRMDHMHRGGMHAWGRDGRDGERPGMGGPGSQFRGRGGQFRRPQPPPPPNGAAPQGAPAAGTQPSGTGEEQ
ncbi:MAG: periplasmic heavy metal sensor [Terracidiphilus sp.]